MEHGPLERQWTPIDPDEQHAARHVCGVEYVVRQRRCRILYARWPMHERRWAECRFANRRSGECHIQPAAERHAPRGGELHEEVVRMLVIRDLKSTVRFALLKDRGVARLAHRERFSTEHARERKGTAPEAMRAHGHQPILRSEVGFAAPSSLDVERAEQRAVEMQTPCGCLLDVLVLSFLRLHPSVSRPCACAAAGTTRYPARAAATRRGRMWATIMTASSVGGGQRDAAVRSAVWTISSRALRPRSASVPGLARLDFMAAFGIIDHVLERCLQGARPFDPCPGVLVAPDEDDERRDASSVGARMAAHERSAERPIEDSDVHIGQRRETNHIRDGVRRVGAPVLGDDQQAQVVARLRETIDERGRDGRMLSDALPQVPIGGDGAQEQRPGRRAFVQGLDCG